MGGRARAFSRSARPRLNRAAGRTLHANSAGSRTHPPSGGASPTDPPPGACETLGRGGRSSARRGGRSSSESALCWSLGNRTRLPHRLTFVNVSRPVESLVNCQCAPACLEPCQLSTRAGPSRALSIVNVPPPRPLTNDNPTSLAPAHMTGQGTPFERVHRIDALHLQMQHSLGPPPLPADLLRPKLSRRAARRPRGNENPRSRDP